MKKIFVLALLLVPQFVSAQSACAPLFPVSMSLTSELSSTVTSASVGFHALLQNRSASLINDVRLAVQVSDKKTGAAVDRFVTAEPIALLKSNAGKADFIWKVPSGLPSGVYTVTARLVSASTTRAAAFVPGIQPVASRDITVSGGVPQASVSAVSVNGSAYRSGTAVPIAGGTTQVVAATLNGTQAPFKGALTWRLFASDATLFDEPLDTKTERVELHPGTTVNATYALTNTSREGYYLEGELAGDHSQSFVDVWLGSSNAFPQLSCATPAAASPASGDTLLIVGGIAALLVMVLAWQWHQRRTVV